MSTRSIVGTITKTGKFHGRYVHSDGYPTGRGPVLANIIARADGNLAFVLDTIMKASPNGWSYLDGDYAENYLGAERADHVRNFGLRYTDGAPSEPYIRGSLHEESDDCFLEWGYFFTSRDETKAELVVTELRKVGGSVMDDTYRSQQVEVARIKVTELHKMTERDWAKIECGEHFERCSHYAWAHLPELGREALGDVSMSDLLSGEATLPCRKATHAVYKGRKYSIGGGHSGGLGGRGKPGLWYGYLTDVETGEHIEAPLFRTNSRSGEDKPISTTELIFPDLAELRELAGI